MYLITDLTVARGEANKFWIDKYNILKKKPHREKYTKIDRQIDNVRKNS